MSYRLNTRHNLQDLHHRLIDFNKSLSEKPEEAHFLWGERIVTWIYLDPLYPKGPGPQVKNYFSLENLASRILKISQNPDGLSLQERAAGIQIVEKTLSLYQHTDDKLPFKSLITRILAAIREWTWLSCLFPVVDQNRLQLGRTAKKNLASFEELDFRKEFHVPADMRLEDHPAFSSRVTVGGQTRIIAKTDIFLEKTLEPRKLINTLLQEEDPNDPYIQALDSSSDFGQNPTKVMILGMIHRGVHMAMEHDSTRARIIGRIPGFIEQATSIEYLRAFADRYYCSHIVEEIDKKLQVFEKSLVNADFLELLDKAKKHYDEGEFYYADNALRMAYQIFPCADNFEEYRPPEFILEDNVVRQ